MLEATDPLPITSGREESDIQKDQSDGEDGTGDRSDGQNPDSLPAGCLGEKTIKGTPERDEWKNGEAFDACEHGHRAKQAPDKSSPK